MFYIDKSVFDANERAEYERLIAKGKVEIDPEGNEEEMEEEKPAFPPKQTEKAEVEDWEEAKKSASSELAAAMEELQSLKKSMEMKEMADVAKKYAPLGKNEAELAMTLYEMKKSNQANYDAYTAILDEHLSLVEKSPVFSEIGKSDSNGSALYGAEAKADAKAREIMKSDNCDYDEAIAKAWEDPQLMAEYDAEYYGK